MDPVPQPDNEIPPPLGELLRRLIADILAWLEAEREVYDVQARLTRRATGWVAAYAFAAVVLAQGAMIALVVGILLTLVPVMGPAWATTLIVLVCSVVVALCIWAIRLKLRSVKLAWRRRNDG